jgi:hypothetical protein
MKLFLNIPVVSCLPSNFMGLAYVIHDFPKILRDPPVVGRAMVQKFKPILESIRNRVLFATVGVKSALYRDTH